jgi:hypothetical protein
MTKIVFNFDSEQTASAYINTGSNDIYIEDVKDIGGDFFRNLSYDTIFRYFVEKMVCILDASDGDRSNCEEDENYEKVKQMALIYQEAVFIANKYVRYLRHKTT